MKNFNHQIKEEVALIIPNAQDEATSELSAMIKTGGEICRNGKNNKIVFKTEFVEVCKLLDKIVSLLYGKNIKYELTTDNAFSKSKYQIEFPEDLTQQILSDTEIVQFDEQNFLSISQEISPYMIAEPNLATSYLRGAFLTCGSCNINLSGENFQKRATGYHLEFVFQNQQFAQNFGLFLADFDIITKTIERNDNFVVYIKGLDMISDILVLCGANKSVLALQNESAMRSIRNTINRQTNCISANLTKTVDASFREMEAIDTIRDTVGIDSLDENLREICYLRIANPEESLENLAKLSNPTISRSAMYRRLKKIENIAKELKK